MGEFRKVLWYFSIWFKGWVGHFADFRKYMMGSISKGTDPPPLNLALIQVIENRSKKVYLPINARCRRKVLRILDF